MDVRKRRQERRQAALLSSAATASAEGVVKPPLEEEVLRNRFRFFKSHPTVRTRELWNRKTTFRL